MIVVQKAEKEHVDGIVSVCIDAQWATYGESHTKDYIQRVIDRFYNHDRVLEEVTSTGFEWGGYFVALENGEVIGAGGGGMTSETAGEVFVLYLNPERRNEGIGSLILEAITKQQKEFGAEEQWVSVSKENEKGIPFYEAKGFIYQHDQDTYEKLEDEEYVSFRYCRTI
jgi:GNAT superfamily N-acetyltransferase